MSPDSDFYSPPELAQLLGVTLSPTRMKCGLLGWKALQKAVAEQESNST